MDSHPPSTSTPTSKIPHKSITRAVKALLKWKHSQPSKPYSKPYSNSSFLYLTLTLHNPLLPNRPPVSNNPYTIPLPNPLLSPYTPSFHICLLVKDRFSQPTKHKIESELLPISNVIKLSHFRTKFNSFEAKKQLCDSYDVFLADKSLIPELPKLLGRYFYKRGKDPIGIELRREDWKDQIELALGSARLELTAGKGSCSVVRVAREEMGLEGIVENVRAAVDGVVGVVPKRWRNVKALHLKFPESLAMPIYGDESVVEEQDEKGSDGSVGKKKRKLEKLVSNVEQDEIHKKRKSLL